MLEAQARAVAGLDRLRREHGEARLALVSHADVIKAVLAFILGVSLDGLHRFEVDPASVSTVVVGDWGAKVLGMNGTAGA
jgi:probable phosphoglycerate mutase